MMDELELLKKDWQRKGEALPKLTYDEIYRMLWKKSSSIVKWMFYISLIELVFWIVMSALPFFWSSFKKNLEQTYGNGDQVFFIASSVFGILIVLIFIYYLFKSYKAISTVDSVKKLMESILRTRLIVRYYVVYNLIMAVIMTLYTFYTLFTHDKKTIQLLDTVKDNGSELRFWLVSGLIVLAGIGFMVGIIWLFYRLVYGILLKRLNTNYKELKRLEV
ncbi:hypothetical protein [Pricia sp.]|uniref:hypothetical protein n=1 Tax=Pricia sp. TaxID=2268138 RepID=UPI0035946538